VLLTAVSFSPDGKTILTGSSDRTARLWDAATRQPKGEPLRQEYEVVAVAYSPDGKTVLVASGTSGRGWKVRLWDAETGRPRGIPLRPDGWIKAAAFSPDGKTFVTGAGSLARFWRVPTPITGDAERITLWAQVATGMELDAAGQAKVLDAQAWQERRQRLEHLGGPPVVR
jgi:WD40 repeat protein